MKIDIEPDVGNNFFALINGKIHKAIITKIEIQEQIYNFSLYLNGDLHQKKRTILYTYKYKVLYNDNINYKWNSDNTQNLKIFHKTKKDAAIALLNEAGFEPGLGELIS